MQSKIVSGTCSRNHSGRDRVMDVHLTCWAIRSTALVLPCVRTIGSRATQNCGINNWKILSAGWSLQISFLNPRWRLVTNAATDRCTGKIPSPPARIAKNYSNKNKEHPDRWFGTNHDSHLEVSSVTFCSAGLPSQDQNVGMPTLWKEYVKKFTVDSQLKKHSLEHCVLSLQGSPRSLLAFSASARQSLCDSTFRISRSANGDMDGKWWYYFTQFKCTGPSSITANSQQILGLQGCSTACCRSRFETMSPTGGHSTKLQWSSFGRMKMD